MSQQGNVSSNDIIGTLKI